MVVCFTQVILNFRVLVWECLQGPDAQYFMIAGDGLLQVVAPFAQDTKYVDCTQVILKHSVLKRKGFQGPDTQSFMIASDSLFQIVAPFPRDTAKIGRSQDLERF